MKLKYSIFISSLLLVLPTLYGENETIKQGQQIKSYHREKGFIANKQELKHYYGRENVVMIASPGRSGSTMLTDIARKYATNYKVLKTHLLPPNAKYKGKILFIFSNPDKAAESALHLVLNSRSHGATHFSNVESADQAWFSKIGRNCNNQTEKDNLLAYDALGCTKQLKKWLYEELQPSDLENAQILAIKFENLWEPETIQAIQNFLNITTLKLPPKRERGCDLDDLSTQELNFRMLYNVGTQEEPIYHAYDEARVLWEQAPSFQFLKFKNL